MKFLLRVNDQFNRKIEGGKLLPQVLTFESYKELLVVKHWVDIKEWDLETFERLCEINHFDSDNM